MSLAEQERRGKSGEEKLSLHSLGIPTVKFNIQLKDYSCNLLGDEEVLNMKVHVLVQLVSTSSVFIFKRKCCLLRHAIFFGFGDQYFSQSNISPPYPPAPILQLVQSQLVTAEKKIEYPLY